MKPLTLDMLKAVLAQDESVSAEDRKRILTAARTGKDVDAVLSASEVAARLGVTRRTIWRWVEAGKLMPIRVSDRVLRFDQADVDALLKPGKGKAKAKEKPRAKPKPKPEPSAGGTDPLSGWEGVDLD